jgi:peptidoglycan/LPS O-acetylase OafA/YrhL
MAATPSMRRDPEAGFAVADPGKAWRRGHRIPVVPAFDGYRGWAVLAVVLFHVLQISGASLTVGDSPLGILTWGILPSSIQVFFIISGFVIYLPTVARNGDFGRTSNFAIRRSARLFPAYYGVLLVALLLLAVLNTTPAFPFPDAGTVAAHFAVLQTPALLFVDHFNLGFGVDPPVWTLSVEIGFYVVLPFVAVAYFRHPFIGLLVAAATVVVWRELALHADSVAHLLGTDLSADAEGRISTFYASQFPSWVLAIATGMTGAWAYVRLRDRIEPERLARIALRVAGASLLVLAALSYFQGREAVTSFVQFQGLFAHLSIYLMIATPLVLGVLMVALTLAPACAQWPFTTPVVRWIGDVGYAFYLFHFAVIWFYSQELSLPRDGTIGAVLVWLALVVPVAFLYAYLSGRYLEAPIRRWAHRFGRRAQESPTGHLAVKAG